MLGWGLPNSRLVYITVKTVVCKTFLLKGLYHVKINQTVKAVIFSFNFNLMALRFCILLLSSFQDVHYEYALTYTYILHECTPKSEFCIYRIPEFLCCLMIWVPLPTPFPVRNGSHPPPPPSFGYLYVSVSADLKGLCHEYFWFFSWISFPQAPEYTNRAVSNIFKNICGDIRSSRCTTAPVWLTLVANGKNLKS